MPLLRSEGLLRLGIARVDGGSDDEDKAQEVDLPERVLEVKPERRSHLESRVAALVVHAEHSDLAARCSSTAAAQSIATLRWAPLAAWLCSKAATAVAVEKAPGRGSTGQLAESRVLFP